MKRRPKLKDCDLKHWMALALPKRELKSEQPRWVDEELEGLYDIYPKPESSPEFSTDRSTYLNKYLPWL